jgi:hypothetical protein
LKKYIIIIFVFFHLNSPLYIMFKPYFERFLKPIDP